MKLLLPIALGGTVGLCIGLIFMACGWTDADANQQARANEILYAIGKHGAGIVAVFLIVLVLKFLCVALNIGFDPID